MVTEGALVEPADAPAAFCAAVGTRVRGGMEPATKFEAPGLAYVGIKQSVKPRPAFPFGTITWNHVSSSAIMTGSGGPLESCSLACRMVISLAWRSRATSVNHSGATSQERSGPYWSISQATVWGQVRERSLTVPPFRARMPQEPRSLLARP